MSGTAVFGYADSDSEDELPAGWEERTTLDGRVYYANHLEKKTTFTDPRLAFAVEESGNEKDSSPPRQKYDASTRAMEILHGMDLSGKVVLITGANSGIGRRALTEAQPYVSSVSTRLETARCLAIHNAHVFMACRNVKAAELARENILTEKGSCNVQIMECDLSSLRSVKQCAQTFLNEKLPLHMLILNAAVFALPYEKTEDTQLEKTFAVNHLGHFYLSKLLSVKMVESSPARVVVVSSESHRQAPIFTNLQPDAANLTLDQLSPPTYSKYWWLHAYNMSKLCNIWFASEFNRRFYAKKVTCNALHPGNMISTGLSRQSCLMRTLFTLVRPFTKSLEQGAATTVFCAVGTDLEGIGGQYLNNCWFCEPGKMAMNEKMQRKLWQLSEEIIEVFENGK